MLEVLSQKKKEVVASLIERVSGRNQDFENCLNAHSILLDLACNDSTFGKLIQRDNFVALIKAACDMQNPNQAYALSILTNAIKEYPDNEK